MVREDSDFLLTCFERNLSFIVLKVNDVFKEFSSSFKLLLLLIESADDVRVDGVIIKLRCKFKVVFRCVCCLNIEAVSYLVRHFHVTYPRFSEQVVLRNNLSVCNKDILANQVYT